MNQTARTTKKYRRISIAGSQNRFSMRRATNIQCFDLQTNSESEAEHTRRKRTTFDQKQHYQNINQQNKQKMQQMHLLSKSLNM
jgi:hypothetical protein